MHVQQHIAWKEWSYHMFVSNIYIHCTHVSPAHDSQNIFSESKHNEQVLQYWTCEGSDLNIWSFLTFFACEFSLFNHLYSYSVTFNLLWWQCIELERHQKTERRDRHVRTSVSLQKVIFVTVYVWKVVQFESSLKVNKVSCTPSKSYQVL